jgi:hypothetical protein
MPGPPGSSNYRTSQTLFCPFLAAAPQHVGAADTGPGESAFSSTHALPLLDRGYAASRNPPSRTAFGALI